MIYKHGKKNIREIKKMFVDNNVEMVIRDSKIFSRMKKLGLLEQCIVCKNSLEDVLFIKHKLKYYSCNCCGMVGVGTPRDYNDFFNLFYGDQDYGDYDKFSNKRIQQIYIPKVEFLIDVIPNLKELGVVDFGSGMGYFVAALNQLKIKASGFEINKNHVNYANNHLGIDNVYHRNQNDILLSPSNGNSVASMIGVLEHLQDPIDAISSIIKSGYEYLYISVPMVGLSSFIEALSDSFYHRHLAPDHLYAFSDKTLQWIESELSLQRIGQWNFGTDADDLFRLLTHKTNDSLEYGLWVDAIQQVIDKNQMSSEIHLVWKLPN